MNVKTQTQIANAAALVVIVISAKNLITTHRRIKKAKRVQTQTLTRLDDAEAILRARNAVIRRIDRGEITTDEEADRAFYDQLEFEKIVIGFSKK